MVYFIAISLICMGGTLTILMTDTLQARLSVSMVCIALGVSENPGHKSKLSSNHDENSLESIEKSCLDTSVKAFFVMAWEPR